ncbi:MAG: protein translocase subunit SecF [Leptospiraceae bacterium]|nr:protein translocase subunit SecF [Leptospiraceae bacterium]
MTLSFVAAIVMFAATFSIYGGFKRSITFNGGIRLTLVLPPEMGKENLAGAVDEAGFEQATIRVTDIRQNIFDVELGPDVRDDIADIIKQEFAANRARANEMKEQGLEVPEELLRRPTVSDYIEERMLPLLGLDSGSVISRETIAASYGQNLQSLALQLFFGTVVAIGLYLTVRFDFPFAVGASMALVHDIVLTLAFIGIMQLEPSVPLVAAVLTIVGYSINDTIVIFDRIRENINDRQQATVEGTIDLAITQTLSRTIVSSILTLLSVLALMLGGESSLRDFAIVLLFGIIIGTYSSIFIATPVVQIYEQMRGRWK